MSQSGLEGWGEYKNLVLKELERLEADLKGLSTALGKLDVDVALLKQKAGLFGAVAGALVGALVSALVRMLTG